MLKRCIEFSLNFFLIVISVLATLVLVNVFFNMAMPRVVNQKVFPRQLIRELGLHYQTFYPDINDGTFTDWTAILGDSYAVGFGDAYRNNEPEYSIFHHIHRATGKNFYMFARGGFGSINSVREYFLTSDEIDKALFYPTRKDPGQILFLFYEGNDLNNNIDHYKAYGGDQYKTIDEFVVAEISKPARSSRLSEVYLPVFDLVDLDSLKSFFQVKEDTRNEAKGWADNVIRFEDGRTMPYPRVANGAAPELDAKDLNASLQMFYSSMNYLKGKTSGIPIMLVYIPSVITVYDWQDSVHVRLYHSNGDMTVSAADNMQRSQYIRSRMSEYCKAAGIDFFDLTPMVRSAAKTTYLHGTGDMGHFNGATYRLIAEQLMLSNRLNFSGTVAPSAPAER